MRNLQFVFGIFLGFVFGLCWSATASLPPASISVARSDLALEVSPLETSLRQCVKEANRTKDTDARDVCFTRKQALCLRQQQIHNRKLKAACLRTLATQTREQQIICARNQAQTEADLETCQSQNRILASKRCPPPNCTLPWAFGTAIGIVGGGLIGGIIGHGTCTPTR